MILRELLLRLNIMPLHEAEELLREIAISLDQNQWSVLIERSGKIEEAEFFYSLDGRFYAVNLEQRNYNVRFDLPKDLLAPPERQLEDFAIREARLMQHFLDMELNYKLN